MQGILKDVTAECEIIVAQGVGDDERLREANGVFKVGNASKGVGVDVIHVVPVRWELGATVKDLPRVIEDVWHQVPCAMAAHLHSKAGLLEVAVRLGRDLAHESQIHTWRDALEEAVHMSHAHSIEL